MDVYIAALDPGQRYPPAQASGEGNDCRCSTIYYSMLSACAYCQGRSWISWDAQTIPNCVSTFDRHFPISMPSGVRVPSWANLDIIVSFALIACRGSFFHSIRVIALSHKARLTQPGLGIV
ncbi:hypothetical protein CVT24_000129 [Panaeolus cyanescens]|uniref:Uncharacterized protein n=1 Tax=Panaeolus cyanescens TaxID=181874 RepID=A0A409X9H6_9AGAR|nr:hypothetical protein CVT24_000129 [Panaeolus cyanescens]